MSANRTLEEFISDTRKHLESEEFDSALKVLLAAIKIFPNARVYNMFRRYINARVFIL